MDATNKIWKKNFKICSKIAVDMVKEKLISKKEAVMRIDPDSLDTLLHPTLDEKSSVNVIASGLPASPGAASGKVVFSSDEAERLNGMMQDTILVRVETSPEDIHGMHAAKGNFNCKRWNDKSCCSCCKRNGKTMCFWIK